METSAEAALPPWGNAMPSARVMVCSTLNVSRLTSTSAVAFELPTAVPQRTAVDPTTVGAAIQLPKTCCCATGTSSPLASTRIL